MQLITFIWSIFFFISTNNNWANCLLGWFISEKPKDWVWVAANIQLFYYSMAHSIPMLNIVLFSAAQKFSKLLYLKYLSNHSCDYLLKKNAEHFVFASVKSETNNCIAFVVESICWEWSSKHTKCIESANNLKSFAIQFMPVC